ELRLENNLLSESVPDFSNLPALQDINLSGNQLNGRVPDFNNLPALQGINLSGNQLSGSIPDFSSRPALQSLNLSGNQLSGRIPDFSSRPALQSLNLSGNQLSGRVPDFNNLPALQNLHLPGNQLSGRVPYFNNLPALQHLNLSGNQLSGSIPEFNNLPALIRLQLSNNRLSGDVPAFITRQYTERRCVSNCLYFFDAPEAMKWKEETIYNLGSFSLGFNCGLKAYSAEQATLLNQRDRNWKTAGTNCGCAIYSPGPPNLTIPCVRVNNTVYSAAMNFVPAPPAILRFEADNTSIEEITLTEQCAVYPFGSENRLRINCLEMNGSKLWAELALAPHPSAIQFDLADFGYVSAANETLPSGSHPPHRIFHDALPDGRPGPRMMSIPAGTFRMGDIQGIGLDREKPVHDVSLSGFAIGVYEVTFAEYDRFAEAESREKPDDEGQGRGKRPVIHVSWHDATAYAEWLSGQTGHQYRLPTEAEWEYAARAGSETAYHYYGNDENRLSEYAWYLDSSGGAVHPVGEKLPNQWGLHDMYGNLWEWVHDRQGAYSSEALTNPSGPDSGSSRLIRGGGRNDEAEYCRSAFRDGYAPGFRHKDLGFRLARTYP
ncbi:MAG: SUMF1/EgtB/PvdO family nonheme iron enzyme, partial [Gammaproteobacteria bacterium]|nr:SUMF1/EgtB/PvdO family nonheme iron enzyme [Gammaproteobacteria bacterium]